MKFDLETMKKLLPLLFLILSLACVNENKPLTDYEKEKIVTEGKETVIAIFQACEKCDPGKLTSFFLNSPDFIAQINGEYSNYAETIKKYPILMGEFKSQKANIISEKYSVLDESTILYSSKAKWECILKNDSLALFDNCGLQLLLKKDASQWKVLSWSEFY